MMSIYPLIVAQHALEGHPSRSEHWNILVPFDRVHGMLYELMGNYDTFTYRAEKISHYLESSVIRGGCQIGEIPADSLDCLATKLSEVQIHRNTPEFDCQTWVIEVMRLLQTCTGYILQDITERSIRAELKLEYERWERADDIIFERIF